MRTVQTQLLLATVLLLSSLPHASAANPDSNFFNVRAYGALGDGKTLDSPAIDKAINAASAAGGGTVLLPAGTYLSGSIHLKSNIHLLLDAGAVILGAPQNLNAYDPTEPYNLGPYQDSGHTYFHNSLIWGENLSNVSITGQGMINGGGLATSLKGDDNPKNFPLRIGNKSIALKLCKNVLLRDITISHGGWFAVLATGCDNLTIDNLTIDTNRDGIDLDCCRNTVVSNCRVNSPHDDAICPKSTHVLGFPRVTENLTITNCQVSGYEEGTLLDGTLKRTAKRRNGRIKFGTESSGGFRNCAVSNCTFRSSMGLALEEVDGGIFENVVISNIAMTDIQNCAIYITTGCRNRTPNLKTPSRMRNVLISNVIADAVDPLSGIQITGQPDQPLDGIRLENIRIHSKGGGTRDDAARQPKELATGYPDPGKLGTMPAYGLFARHVKNLELANITFTFETEDLRPALQFADIDHLELDNIKPQTAKDIPPALFAPDVHHLTLRNSPLLHPPN